MGIHFGLVAAKVSVDQLREEFSRTWPRFEIVALKTRFRSAEKIVAWRRSHAYFVSAADWTKENPGREVHCFWQDGPWAVMEDRSHVLTCDEESLSKLSERIGRVLSFAIETSAGCAFFWCFENGKLRRSILNTDTNVEMEGAPIPEEAGIDVSRYYVDETEALWRALGLSPFVRYGETPPFTGYQAICVIDRTDYGHLSRGGYVDPRSLEVHDAPLRARGQREPRSRKPWWRLW
jgi:hypothetical protein